MKDLEYMKVVQAVFEGRLTKDGDGFILHKEKEGERNGQKESNRTAGAIRRRPYETNQPEA